MDVPGPSRARRKAATVFIFITILLDVIAMGIIIPVLPRLVLDFEGGDAASAAAIYGYFGIIFAVTQFAFAPVLGALSDRFGRRPVLLLSVFGHGLDFILMALAPNLAWLFVGRLISGITAASFSTANAYIVDVTPPDKRAQAFGMMGSAFGFGLIMGPAIGGIIGEIDPRLPFWFAAALCLLNTAYGFFVLPESLPKEQRARFELKKANPIGSIGYLGQRSELAWLAGAMLIFQTAFWVMPTTLVLYGGYRFGWGEADVGVLMAGIGVGNIVTQMLLIRPAVRFLGESLCMRVGLGSAAVGMVIYGLAPVGWVFLIGIAFQTFSGIAGPAIQSIITRGVPLDEQGKLQGALSSVIGIGGMVGPLLFSQIFAWALGPGAGYGIPGVAFLVAAAMMALAIAVSWIGTKRARPRPG